MGREMSSFIILGLFSLVYFLIMRKLRIKFEKEDADILKINSVINDRIKAGENARTVTVDYDTN